MTVTPLSPSTSPILQEIVRQLRAADPYGTYRTWRDELLLKPFVVTKAQKRQISLEGEVDPGSAEPHPHLLPRHCRPD
jgi:hypothetical protein